MRKRIFEKEQVPIKAYFSPKAQDLLQKLLEKNPQERLKAIPLQKQDGLKSLFKDPYFIGMEKILANTRYLSGICIKN